MGDQHGARIRIIKPNRHKNTLASNKPFGLNRAPTHSILKLQQTIGNQAVQYLAKTCPIFPSRCPFKGNCHTCPAKIQAKLSVGQPGDQYEREADRVADTVMRMAASTNTQHSTEGQISGASSQVTPELERRINTICGAGKPLPQSERNFFEPYLGYDFSRVRVHYDSRAAKIAKLLNAKAFTVGRDIMFGEGQYKPCVKMGNRLLAHELAHVMQQRNMPALQMYGKDVHFWHTLTWAENIALNIFGEEPRAKTVAEIIAREDQRVDEGWTQPYIATPILFGASDLIHFPSKESAESDVQYGIKMADPVAFGWGLHRYQDTFSHSFPPDALFGQKAAIKHALLGFYPDDFRKNPEQMARDQAMERASKNLIEKFYYAWGMRIPELMGMVLGKWIRG